MLGEEYLYMDLEEKLEIWEEQMTKQGHYVTELEIQRLEHLRNDYAESLLYN